MDGQVNEVTNCINNKKGVQFRCKQYNTIIRPIFWSSGKSYWPWNGHENNENPLKKIKIFKHFHIIPSQIFTIIPCNFNQKSTYNSMPHTITCYRHLFLCASITYSCFNCYNV